MNLAKKFIEGVTEQQLEDYINAVFKTVNKNVLVEILDKTNPELKSFVNNLLSEKPKENLSTNDKFIQNWELLKSEIFECIFELGIEEGKYTDQDAPWDQPYFNSYSFSDDLENIFEKMLPMIDKVYKITNEEIDFFTDILTDIITGINSYPEWMGEPYDNVVIGKNGLECILKSEFLKADSVSTFLDNVIKIWNHKYEYIRFSSNEPISFITKETESVQREFYNEFRKRKDKDEWERHLNNTDSMWHKTFHKLTERFDKDLFLRNSEELISKNWNYGVPVYKNYLKLKKYDEAEKICSKIADNYIIQQSRSDKNNFENCLIKSCYYKKEKSVIDFLNDWKNICQKLKLKNKKNAIKFQIQFYNDSTKWEKLKKLLKNIEEPYKTNYLTNWKENNDYYYSWVKWLIDAEANDAPQQFIDNITKWLNEKFDVAKEEKALFFLIYNFDIDDKYSQLKKLANDKTGHYYKKIHWLTKEDYLQLKSILLQFLKNNINKLIPSPENVHKYDYSEHAIKLVVAKELNEKIYSEFLDLWRVKYKRKKNLWKELEKFGINK